MYFFHEVGYATFLSEEDHLFNNNNNNNNNKIMTIFTFRFDQYGRHT